MALGARMSTAQDIEMQPLEADGLERRRHVEATRVLFGLTEQEAQRYPGLCVFYRHLEDRHTELVNDFSLNHVAQHVQGVDINDSWSWYLKIMRIWQGLPTGTDPDLTFEQIFCGLGIQEQPCELKLMVAQALVTTLSLISGTLVPAQPSTLPGDAGPGSDLEDFVFTLGFKYAQFTLLWKGTEAQSLSLVFGNIQRQQSLKDRHFLARMAEGRDESIRVEDLSFSFISKRYPKIRFVDSSRSICASTKTMTRFPFFGIDLYVLHFSKTQQMHPR